MRDSEEHHRTHWQNLDLNVQRGPTGVLLQLHGLRKALIIIARRSIAKTTTSMARVKPAWENKQNPQNNSRACYEFKTLSWYIELGDER